MAVGRVRTNKRSSGSYTSTITTIILIALCVAGLWLLTSDSVVNPQTTTHESSSTTTTATKFDDKPTTTTKIVDKPTTTTSTIVVSKPNSFEDNSGYLPADAIRNDDSRKQGEQKADPARGDSKQDNVAKGEEKDVDFAAAGANENAQGLSGNVSVEDHTKQNEHEILASEESSFTQNQRSNVRREDVDHQKGSQDVADNVKNEDENVEQQEKPPKIDELNNPEEIKGRDEKAETGTNPSETQKQPQEEEPNQPGKPVTFTDETKKDQPGKQEGEDQASKEEAQQGVKTPQEPLNDSAEAQDESSKSTLIQEAKEQSTTLPNSGIPKESKESKKAWSTQAAESHDEKERHKEKSEPKVEDTVYGYTWKLCNVTTGADYIPCLDNLKAIKKLKTTKHFQHRERHCPEDPPTCLVQLPEFYKKPIPWPDSRNKIWFHNVPHTELAKVKGHQNWVKVSGEFLTFPGGGTQFIHGALHYINFIEKSVPDIAWGRHTRVVLDVGCGVASFGGYLFEKDVLTMSFAPNDEHEAQVQFALERGIPAISAVMGSQRLPFPSRVFDVVHCARCRVPWHAEGGRLLLELNRVLRPGGWFVWSATPVYQKLPEDIEIWNAMTKLTASLCWKLETIQNNKINKVAAAIFRKPTRNDCYDQREQENPPMCKIDDDPNAAWHVPIQKCMHRVPVEESDRGSKWPPRWPKRLRTTPYWLNNSQMGIYGKPAPDDFTTDYEHWKFVVNKSYLTSLGISWSDVRNVMDMRAVYGGFAAALKDLKVWVMNVVSVNAPDTLPIIYERGLFGIYHDWCESFSTYPRSYDLLHADHLFSQLKTRCKIAPVMAEVDRIVRPGGKLIVRDESSVIGEVENQLKSLHWEVHLTFSKDQEGILSATKSDWRPETFAQAA